jgi:hypothetical protein
MAKQPPKKRRQTAQVNVRLLPEQLERLTKAVEKLQAEQTKLGARFSLSGFMLDSALAAADKITGK